MTQKGSFGCGMFLAGHAITHRRIFEIGNEFASTEQEGRAETYSRRTYRIVCRPARYEVPWVQLPFAVSPLATLLILGGRLHASAGFSLKEISVIVRTAPEY